MIAGLLEWAKYYVETLGWSVIPIRPDNKRPLFRWEAFQGRSATTVELERWFRQPQVGLAVVTGEISQLVILDIDVRNGGLESIRDFRASGKLTDDDRDTIAQQTPSGGWHLLYQYPGVPVANGVGIAPGLDIRGTHGYAVCAPTQKTDGTGWNWLPGRAPWEKELRPCPQFILERARPKAEPTGGWSEDELHSALYGVEQGSRDATGYRLLLHWIQDGGDFVRKTETGRTPHYMDSEEAGLILRMWGQLCNPPMGSLPGEKSLDDWVEEKKASAIKFIHEQEEKNKRANPSMELHPKKP